MHTHSEADLGVGELLVRYGAIRPDQFEEALDLATRWQTPIAEALMSRWWIRADVYSRAVAIYHGLPFLRLTDEPCDEALLTYADVDFCLQNLLLPWRSSDGVLQIATPSPGPKALLAARGRWGSKIAFVVTPREDIAHAVASRFGAELSHAAVHELEETDPEMSARRVISRGQAVALYVAVSLVAGGLAFEPVATLIALNALMTLFYFGSFVFKALLVWAGGTGQLASTRAIDSEVRLLRDEDLPVFTILVPMFREPDVLPILVRALRNLHYPLAKLDIKIVLEESDHETIAAAQALALEPIFEIIIVPPSQPQTKPKACNYALRFARGEFLVIYDAEDKPEPDQLRKVVAAFRRMPAETACIQCRLNYFNSRENWLTRMFTLDYSLWFDLMLPGLQKLGVPIPLGGTSNHFRIEVLRELHAWDPFNVTEDADLGVRLAQRGYGVGVIDSTTYEEANCDPMNWIRQRSRWIKGYMQTTLVHSRRPLKLLRAVGPLGVVSLLFFIGGTALSGLLSPICWVIFLLWLATSTTSLGVLFPPALLYFSLVNLIAGNGLFIYLMMIAPFRRRWTGLSPWALTAFGYWVLMSIAAWKALGQLLFRPFYWEKTNHGLSQQTARELAAARVADARTRDTELALR